MGDRLTKTRRCDAPRGLARCCSCTVAAGCGSSSKSSSALTHQHDRRRPGRPPAAAGLEGHQERGRSDRRPRPRRRRRDGRIGRERCDGRDRRHDPARVARIRTDEVLHLAQHVLVVPQGPRREVHRRPRREQPELAGQRPELHQGAVDVRGQEQHRRRRSRTTARSRTTSRPTQIKVQNKGYLTWRDCMIGRGWGIPEPKPDSKGRLFSFSTSGGERRRHAELHAAARPGHRDEQ